ncbi:MAG: twin transmembrane helix small protein [Thalassobaculum sp.]|uniref:twin transmembrane helix small protein n=1 Tax=Thalassobaculum sp. TaxID=2022740 RepID=UPI0032EDC088
MNTLFTVVLILAMAATVGALVWGLIAMARGGEFNAKWSNKMMRYRVLFQAVALAVFALLLSLTKG